VISKVRYDNLSSEPKDLLQSGDIVDVQPLDPSTLILEIGSTYKKSVFLPLQLNTNASAIKIARKLLQITYTAPVVTLQALATRLDSVFPMDLDNNK
jgi:hypothetical protein